MNGWNQDDGRGSNTLMLGEEPLQGVQPGSAEDARRYLLDSNVSDVDLGSAREKNVLPTTWHS